MSEERVSNAAIEDFERLQSLGWSASASGIKLAAMKAFAELAPPEPVASVNYISRGRLLVVGPRDAALAAAERLKGDLDVHVLAADAVAASGFLAWQGAPEQLTGYLGAFEAVWRNGKYPQTEPIVLASAEGEAVVSASNGACTGRFDLVLDFSTPPLFDMHQPPQGYVAVAGKVDLEAVYAELIDMVGEFEKPKFFAYKEKICAHSRSRQEGCNRCIEICSTRAISSDGDHVKVDPHLCMGCGACATVCPSGAMSYQYPRVADRGAQLRALLGAYRQAGGANPCVLVHNAMDGRDLLAEGAHTGPGLPDHVLPLEAWHVASIGIDVLLGTVCYGANNVVLLSTGSEAAEYAEATKAEMAMADTILNSLGYAGSHFAWIEAKDGQQLAQAMSSIQPATVPATLATFYLGNDKRTTLEFIIEHLAKHAPTPKQEIPLTTGAPYGQIKVDAAKCTMCMACTGACPESALMDSADYPRLKFVERNCVQCGLCENTCPENAITLNPRLLLTPQWKQEVLLNEAEPFNCISCGKALGTKQMITSMLGKLAGHSMFQGDGKLKRLQMCADCRIVDMMESKDEMSILSGEKRA
jgi:ferredoxin